jgi:hypothetical protein
MTNKVKVIHDKDSDALKKLVFKQIAKYLDKNQDKILDDIIPKSLRASNIKDIPLGRVQSSFHKSAAAISTFITLNIYETGHNNGDSDPVIEDKYQIDFSLDGDFVDSSRINCEDCDNCDGCNSCKGE